MKRFLVLATILIASTLFAAAPPVMEAPISAVGTPTTVSISSTTLTKIPTSQLSGRIGVYVDNPNTNLGRMVGFLGDCVSTTSAATVRPIEISTTTDLAFFPIREDVCLWFVTTYTGAASESIHYQEVKK